ncbi:MAG: RNA polymerase sigma factor [Patescibacteria group bacterium]
MEDKKDPNGKTDEELVAKTLKNRDDFVYLINRYESRLYNYIRRITNVPPDEAEDILQDIFIKVFRNLNDFDQDLKFSSWIYRIAHNQVISNFRKRKARPENYSVELSEGLIQTLAGSLDIEKETDRKLLKENIIKGLGKIDKKYREVLMLRFLEEKSYEEISDILMKPKGTIATLLNKAKKEFLKQYKKQKINI